METEPLTDREIIILATCSSVVLLVLLIATVLLVFYYIKRQKRKREKHERLSRTLESISLRDPLEELVRRESRRSFYEEVAISNTDNLIEENDTRRKMFKLWTCDRQIKTYVFAGEVEELLQKGTTKLGLRYPDKLVLEEDGTQIDDDEMLIACAGRVFIILEKGDRWTPRSIVMNVEDLENHQHKHNNINLSYL